MEISQEFFEPERLKANLPQFIADLRNFFQRDEAPSQDFANLPAPRKVGKQLDRVSYADLREKEIFIPAGLNVTYPEYLDVLEQAVESASAIHKDILEPVSLWLGIILSDPRGVLSSRGHGLEKFEPHNIDKHYNDIGKCFVKGNNRNRAQVKDAFGRNKDIVDSVDQLQEMTASFVRTGHKSVVESTEEITELLQRFIERFEEGEEGYDIPKQHLEFLSKVGYTLAQEVEFYSVVNYHLTATTKAMKDTLAVFDI